MGTSQKLLGLGGCNIDADKSLMPPDKARFSKGYVWEDMDPANVGIGNEVKAGTRKSLQSTIPVPTSFLTGGTYSTCGRLGSDETGQVIVMEYNSLGNHLVYRIRGNDGGVDKIYQSPLLNFQNDPRYFMGEGQISLKYVYVTDPVTGNKLKRTFLDFTDGFNNPRQICIEDSIATSGFDPTLFPYFAGDYDQSIFINMGLPTPDDCIQIVEVPRDENSKGLPNNLLFKPWYFRISATDVYGRPTEHGIISTQYNPGINDCISSSNSLPRCLTLTFSALTPIVDSIIIEWSNDANQWFKEDTLFLYDGSNLGNWWLRERNTNGPFTYDSGTNTISYTFCRDRECDPIATIATGRLFNPLPRTSEASFSVGPYSALANNKDGFNPFSQDLLNQITATVIPPTKSNIQTATIDILVPIYNPTLNNYQQIIKNGTAGYSWGDDNSKHGGTNNYAQYFQNKSQSGFIGYLVGTGNFVISTQYYLDANNNLVEDTDFKGLENSPRRLVFERFTFTNVPKGTYIFSIASHLADPTTNSSWASTSTTLWGVCPFNGTNFTISTLNRTNEKELVIDVCGGNYSTQTAGEILVIADLAAFYPNGIFPGISAKATCGYIYETNENGSSQFPVELIGLNNVGFLCFTSLTTDRNGFFWFTVKTSVLDTDHHYTTFYYQYKCGVQTFSLIEGAQGMRFFGGNGASQPIFLDQVSGVVLSGGNALSPDYPSLPCNRTLVKGRVTLPNNGGIGVPNATVILTRGGSGTTDDNGNFTIIAHDDVSPVNWPGPGYLRPRQDEIIFVPAGCNYTNASGGCIGPIAITIQICTNCSIYTATNPRQMNVPPILLAALSARGLLSGGTYSLGVVGWDRPLRRCGFVNPFANVTIPTIIQSEAIGSNQIQVQFGPGIVFDSWVDAVSIWITKEITWGGQYIDWIVDRVEFIDNTGNVNNDAPTQIRIYYGSLAEYNKQNNFNTTTLWEFLAPVVQAGEAQTPFTSDIVQFFVNGDGTFYFSKEAKAAALPPTLITALVKYDSTGLYFLIDYTGDLDNLQANSLIRLARPKVCSNTETTPFYEVCGTIPVVNGVVSTEPITLDVFDTYYPNRIIPVPVPVNSTIPLNSTTTTQQQTQTTLNGVTTTVTTIIPNENTVDEQRSFGFPFEHNSPSNFWGQGAWSIGRVNTKDPYASELYHTTEIALSGQISVNDQLNYLNYFDSAQKTSFPNYGLGEIVAVMVQTTRLLVIGTKDYFVVGFGDNILRTDAQGNIIVPSAASQFGNPMSKVGNNFGCAKEDRSTISEYQGLCMFLDRFNVAIIRHDFQAALPVNQGAFDSWLNPQVKFVHEWNLNNPNQKRYFVGCINKINQAYIFTSFLMGSGNFVNNERDYVTTDNDSIEIDSRNGILKGWLPFTAENYASLSGAFKQNQLYSFTNGQPNTHYTTDENRTYGSIYGTLVNRVLRVVIALDNLKKKEGLSVGIYSHNAHFIDQVLTEGGQASRTLLNWIIKANWAYFAPLLCSTTTLPDPNLPNQTGPNSILDGDNLIGTWIDVRVVGNPTDDGTYVELQGLTLEVFPIEKTSANG